MKICILILYTESWQELADVVFPNVHRYVDKHVYWFKPIKHYVFNGFGKLREIKNLLSIYDTVWSMDLDTLITNHSIKVEKFLDDTNDLYFTFDFNGLNCGSFIVIRSVFSMSVLNTALSLEGLPSIHCEQDAFNEIFKLSPSAIFDKVKHLPHPSINSYHYNLYPEIPPQTHEQGNWEEGDFVLHLPGIGMDKRLEILKNTKITY